MRVTVLGDGQLGSQFVRDFGQSDLTALAYPEIDVTNKGSDEKIRKTDPEVIINCVAYTNVDKAEQEPETCRAVNALAPGRISKLAKELGALFVHISTDFVFDGESRTPYREMDQTNPLNTYGKTKLEGELMVLESGAESLIARTAWLNGSRGPNFVIKMLELGRSMPEVKAVTDQVGSPTFTKDLAEAVMALIKERKQGLYHVVNSGQASRLQLVQELYRLAGIDTPIRPAVTADFPTPARRPSNSVLSNDKLSTFYIMRPWQEALAEYLNDLNTPSIN